MMMLSFLPAYAVPFLVALASVYAFTRILPPEEYGLYATVLSAALLCQAVFFSWLEIGAKRFYERAQRDGNLPTLAASIYRGLFLCVGVLVLLAAGGLAVAGPEPSLHALLWLALGMVVARQLALVAKSFRLAALDRRVYTAMECGESLLAFAAGLGLCWFLGLGARGILIGLLLGSLAVVALDVPTAWRRTRSGRFDRLLARDLLIFSAPITFSFFFEYVMAWSNRLLIGLFLDAHAVGIYSVGHSLAERAVSSVFLALALVGYPLLMRTYEREGREAAQRRALANARILLAVAIPTWGGFTVAAGHIAAVLTGPDYAPQVAAIMPLVGAAVFLSCLRAHYLDHAFHLACRTDAFLLTAGPAALVNVLLNVVLLPAVGLMGAVWASLAGYGVALAASIFLSRRVFPLPFPTADAAKAAGATLAMCAVLHAIPFAPTLAGLMGMIMLGVAVYGMLALGFNIGGLRTAAEALLHRRPAHEAG
jgi:O-antigen/teichoic acid export membrane protein